MPIAGSELAKTVSFNYETARRTRGQNGGAIFFVSTSGGNAKNGDLNSDGFREGYGQLWQ